MRSIPILGLFLLLFHVSKAQVVGGMHSFEFLRLPMAAHTTALGSINIANTSSDFMLSTNNPALLRPEFHTQIGLNYNIYYAGTQKSSLYYVHHLNKINTTVALAISYLNYGTFTLTDAIGNVYGDAKAQDYVVQVSASRNYLERWRYGATLKYAGSNLINTTSLAVLADAGLFYADTTNLWFIGIAMKNVGLQLKKYDKTTDRQPLPFDLQVGVTKQFKHLPFRLMLTAHHLYEWDIRYNNPEDVVNNQLLFSDTTQATKVKKYTADKFFRHICVAGEISLGKRIELSVGYNHLRRSELALSEKKGLSGFSMGAGIYLNKCSVHYARSYYHIVGAYNEVGINFTLNQLMGLGKWGNKINWSERFSKRF